MQLATRRLGARFLSAAALAIVPVLALGTSASATTSTQTITYQCQASAVGTTSTFTLNQGLTASAPDTVAAGAQASGTLAPAPNTVPTSAAGYTVQKIRNLVLTAPVPANSSYVSATLSGGSGLNSTPTIAQSNGTITLTVPGPIAGGASFQLPTITLTLKATGSSGATIQTQLGGTSYSSPGLTFTATILVLGFPTDAPSKCYPNPNPVLTTTTIS